MTEAKKGVQYDIILLEQVADYYQRYPGEIVTFYGQLRVSQMDTVGEEQVTVSMRLPASLEPVVDGCSGPVEHGPVWVSSGAADPVQEPEHNAVFWQFDTRLLQSEKIYAYQVQSKILSYVKKDTFQDSWLEVVFSGPGQNDVSQRFQSNKITIQVLAKAESIQHLPGIYQDERQLFLWRYLMYFDRVWSRYNEFLANQDVYFDPRLTPDHFQHWLVSWVGLTLPVQLPKEIRRRIMSNLVLKMVDLNQKRGTKSGLQQLLQIWMDIDDQEVAQCIQIRETIAGNFVLGRKTVLGADLVLGSPFGEVCKFIVRLKWPSTKQPLTDSFIYGLIESWKPAHTTFQLIVNQTIVTPDFSHQPFSEVATHG